MIQGWVLPVTNSPKPPPERITMTLPVINSAKDIVIVAAGEDKVGVGTALTHDIIACLAAMWLSIAPLV
jgi:6-phosphogluconolactonase/glucosamine-6-phosphate isomerase/deaminase